MIAFYLHLVRPESADRLRAVVDAFESSGGTVVVSPDRAPVGWPGSWVRLGDDSVASWKAWVGEHAPAAIVVDGPAEHVRAARDARRTVAVMAVPGGDGRGESGAAYRIADLILAPWAGGADDGWPAAWRARTIYLGAVSAAASRAVRRHRTGRGTPVAGRIRWRCVALTPTAGGPSPRERRDLLLETPGWHWVFGTERDLLEDGPTWDAVLTADVVVCAPAPTNIAALAAARVPAVLTVPERPTAAQLFLAELAGRSAPVVMADTAPGPARWRMLLTEARALDGALWDGWDPSRPLAALPCSIAGAATGSTTASSGGDSEGRRTGLAPV